MQSDRTRTHTHTQREREESNELRQASFPTGFPTNSPTPCPTRIKVLIAHRSPLMRLGLKHLIETRNELEFCAETNDAPTARQLFSDHHPQIVLLGLTLHGGDGIQLIKDLRRLDGVAQIIVFSGRDDALSIQRALRSGAGAYLLTDDDLAEVLRALADISAGHRYVSSNALGRLVEAFTVGEAEAITSDLNKLSDRELEIFSLMGRGFGGSRLAKELRVTRKTIDTHEERMKAKLGCATVPQLREKAVQWVLKCARESLQRGSKRVLRAPRERISAPK